ncbi:MAG: putative membrane protein [Planctomycetota bacterium]|jgi:putative membrane protein
MGFANLVPGISGGTMILAVGLYDRFIAAIAEASRLRPTAQTLRFLVVFGLGALVAVASLSGLLVGLVLEHRWAMYSLFVGMTLGGVPDLVRSGRPWNGVGATALVLGVACMLLVAFALTGTRLPLTTPVLFAAGAIAASSMILPGISGSYLLLLFGLYEAVVGSLSVSVILEDPMAAAWTVGPVLLGAAVGIAALSNVLNAVLGRFPATTHAALLGLLLGSMAGLWPFQEPVHPEMSTRATRKATVWVLAGKPHDEIRAKYGEEFDEARLAVLAETYAGKSVGELKSMGDELQRFQPSGKRVASALALLLLGFGLTRLVGRGGPGRAASSESA